MYRLNLGHDRATIRGAGTPSPWPTTSGRPGRWQPRRRAEHALRVTPGAQGRSRPGVALFQQRAANTGRLATACPAGALGGGDAVVSVYKVIELIGTSEESWEDAAAGAVRLARQSLRELRVAEVVEQDLDLGDGDLITYRTKLRVSFKYEGGQ